MPGNIKILGVGFHKTGTSSLAAALTRLGYRTQRYLHPKDIDTCANPFSLVEPFLDEYDAFVDVPWFTFAKDFYQRYESGVKFILTHRNSAAWLQSAKTHFAHQGTNKAMHRYIYGTDQFEEERYLNIYNAHNINMIGFFAALPAEDSLIMRIAEGDGWEKLCQFLDCEIPDEPFPHKNETKKWITRKK